MTLAGKTRITEVSRPLSPGEAQTRAKKLRHKLLGGSLTLLAGSGLVGVTNLVYNVVTARLLGPTGFARSFFVVCRGCRLGRGRPQTTMVCPTAPAILHTTSAADR